MHKRVTVFGSSSIKEGDKEWETAFEVGKRLAQNGMTVLTGGYGGAMEASSKGAATVGGAKVEGAICSGLFATRKQGNQYLTSTIDTPHLTDRLNALINKSDAFIVLDGKLGTMLELLLVWNMNYCEASFLPNSLRKPVYVFRHPWEKIINTMIEGLRIGSAESLMITFVDSVDEIMDLINKHMEKP
ncbi:hypothetical protein AKO1_014293 [Acrasis kona]|uniref:DNA-binding protein n=1 Tax=Acrasis kona TaxID=1008807 RepID=A0AAW2YZ25_9EUKA